MMKFKFKSEVSKMLLRTSIFLLLIALCSGSTWWLTTSLEGVEHRIDPSTIRVVPCGQAIGVLASLQGAAVVGHLPVRDREGNQHYPARDAGLRVGDVIHKIGNEKINDSGDFERVLSNLTVDSSLKLQISRSDGIRELWIKPIPIGDFSGKTRYVLGIFVEDPVAGIGTLSFYLIKNGYFAGLGHRITLADKLEKISFQSGEIVLAQIKGLESGLPGKPGEKIGVFNIFEEPLGEIMKNSDFGIYGRLNNAKFLLNSKIQEIPIAKREEITRGEAEMLTVLEDSRVEGFAVEILKISRHRKPHDKGLIVQIIDKKLLEKTGGIIQGMSGSPLIQNGRLIGVVTHVFVNDPTKGYAVLAEWMLDELLKMDDNLLKEAN